MANRIHPTAVIGPQVTLGDGNVIGPFCVFQGPVTIGDDNYVGSHVSVGAGPEVYGYDFAATWEVETDEGGVTIGSRNVLKEYVAVNTGWRARSVIGDDCLLMGGTYLAHDTQVADRVTTSRAVLVGGHVVLESDVTLGMGCTVHQRRVVGAASMVGMQAAVTRDVPPFTVAKGVPATSAKLNTFRLDKLGVAEDLHPRLRAVLLDGSRDLTGLPPVVRTPLEAWIERASTTA